MKTIIIWLIFVFILSVYPLEGGASLPYADKFLHFFIYAITAALFFNTFVGKMGLWRALVISFLLSFAYGLFAEIVQIFVPSRSFSVMDLVANGLGVFAYSMIVVFKAMKKKPIRS